MWKLTASHIVLVWYCLRPDIKYCPVCGVVMAHYAYHPSNTVENNEFNSFLKDVSQTSRTGNVELTFVGVGVRDFWYSACVQLLTRPRTSLHLNFNTANNAVQELHNKARDYIPNYEDCLRMFNRAQAWSKPVLPLFWIYGRTHSVMRPTYRYIRPDQQ